MHAVEFNVVSTHPKETTLNERRLIRTAIPELVGMQRDSAPRDSAPRNALRAYWRAGRAL